MLRILAMKLAYKWLKWALKEGVTRSKHYFTGNDLDILGPGAVQVTIKLLTPGEWDRLNAKDSVEVIE